MKIIAIKVFSNFESEVDVTANINRDIFSNSTSEKLVNNRFNF